jgi:hypothetical protein
LLFFLLLFFSFLLLLLNHLKLGLWDLFLIFRCLWTVWYSLPWSSWMSSWCWKWKYAFYTDTLW